MELVKIAREKQREIRIKGEEVAKDLDNKIKAFSERLSNSSLYQQIHTLSLVPKEKHQNDKISSAFGNRRLQSVQPFMVDSSHMHADTIDIDTLAQRLQTLIDSEHSIVGDWQHISQQRIDDFSDITGDKQWIHTDPEKAKRQSPFGSTVAQGFLIISLIPKLCDFEQHQAEYFPEVRMVVNCGLKQARFLRPVRVGSDIRAQMTLVTIRRRQYLELTYKVDIHTEHDNKRVCSANILIQLHV